MIEVGLGGRLDATNVLTPLVTVTTDISFDHMEILGDTLEQIAAEKGGIIKPGVPHVLGILPDAARQTLLAITASQQAPVRQVAEPRARFNLESGTVDYDSDTLKVRNLRPSLVGQHQLKNAAVALETVAVLKEEGLRLPVHAVRDGISRTEWRGRFQIISKSRQPTVILDVCHNAAGARAFAQAFSRRYPGLKVRMIVGFVQKKEHQVMFDSLAEIAQEYWLVPLKTYRSVSLEDVVKSIDFKGVPVRPCRSLAAGWKALVKQAKPGDIIPVIGSHYLVGEYLSRYM